MTAPADDPRGGEAVCTCWHGSLSGYCRDHDKPRIQFDPGHPDAWGCACPRPAAGRGDTDSGGERTALVEAARGWIRRHSSQPDGDRWRDNPSHLEWAAENLLCDLAPWPAARPAGDHVDPAEIVRQRSLGWPDFHPEDYCHTCGRTNPTWFADTAEWQTATDSTGDGGGILCPSCFCALWKKKTGKTAIIWRLSIGGGRDARPAGDRAQPTEGLQEAIGTLRAELARSITASAVWRDKLYSVDRILRDVEDGWQPSTERLTAALRRALGGTT